MLFMLGYIGWVRPLGQETLTVYGQSKAQLPRWFRNHDWQINVEWQRTNILSVADAPLCEWPEVVLLHQL